MSGWPLRTRLTIWYTLALVVVLCLFAVDVVWSQRRLGLARVDRELESVSATIANVLRDRLRGHAGLAIAAESARRSVALAGNTFMILDAHGAPIGEDTLEIALDKPLPSPSARTNWTVEAPKGAWRIHSEPLVVEGTAVTLVAASPLTDVRREQHEVLEAIEVAIPLVLLLAGGGGFWLASMGLRPISDMAKRASDIPLTGTEDLGNTNRRDELGQLAHAFNGLLARLRAVLQAQQQFMADASHEIRTPVSVMRAAAEVGLSREQRDEGEYRESLAIVGDQARRLTRLVEHMMVLARADAGGYPLRPVDLYLDDVVSDCCRALRPLSDQRRIAIQARVSEEVPFRGDEDLLKQLVLNVMQNGVQHSPPGGTVAIDLARNNGRIDLRVSDMGSGIPAADQTRIFDRFVQLDPSRRSGGSGLGLPIARWIANAHGGQLVLEHSGPAGSTFLISLPSAPPDIRGAGL